MYAPFSPAMARIQKNRLRAYLSAGNYNGDAILDETTVGITVIWVDSLPDFSARGGRELVRNFMFKMWDDTDKLVVEKPIPWDPTDPESYATTIPLPAVGSYTYEISMPGATLLYGPEPQNGDLTIDPPEEPEP